MNENIFLSALAGLVDELKKHINLADIVPDEWLSKLPPVDLACELVTGKQRYTKPTQNLQTIFAGIQPENLKNKFLSPKPLEILEDIIFPSPDDGKTRDNGQSRFDSISQVTWTEFLGEAKTLKQAHEDAQSKIQNPKSKIAMEVYVSSLLYLMQHYLWAVPSGYYQPTDVSLYNHSRMVAAVAACLAGQPISSEANVALLVGADISGIQKFIYTITSKGASSGLRGRSMYLQLLTEVVARYLLDKLDLPLTNIIYAGGGHVYLLAPLGCEEKLDEAHRYVSRVLLCHHQGDLYLALAHVPIQANQLHGDALGECWQTLNQKLQQAKLRQFSELDENEFASLFAPQEHGGNEEKQCAVTLLEHPQTQQWEKDELGEPTGPRKSPVTVSFEELGKNLREAKYMCIDKVPLKDLSANNQEPPAEWQVILSHFGYEVIFADSLHVDALSMTGKSIQYRTFLALADDKEIWQDLRYTRNQIIGRHFLVNVTPIVSEAEYDRYKPEIADLAEPDSVKPFDLLAQQSTGVHYLGVLRMDVDNLGKIFRDVIDVQNGKNKNILNDTLYKLAALRKDFGLYVKAYIFTLTEQGVQQAHIDRSRLMDIKIVDGSTLKDKEACQKILETFAI